MSAKKMMGLWLSFILLISLVLPSGGLPAVNASGGLSNTLFFDNFEEATTDNLFTPGYRSLPGDSSKPMYLFTGGSQVAVDEESGAISLPGSRMTIGALSTTPTLKSDTPGGVFNLSKPYKIIINVLSSSGAGKFQVYVDNNTTGQGNSIHGNPSRIYSETADQIPAGEIVIQIDPSIGTTSSFIALRTESSAIVVIDSIAIVTEGDTDPIEPTDPNEPGDPTDPDDPEMPKAPTNLRAAAGNEQVSLKWDAVSGADHYVVKRSNQSGEPYNVLATETGTSYIDTDVTNGTTYYYVVTASRDGEESGPSTEVSATPKAPAPGPIFFDEFEGVTDLFSSSYRSLPADASKPMYIRLGGTVTANATDEIITLSAGRMTIGALSNTSTSASTTPGGVFDLSKPYQIIINLVGTSGTGKLQVYVDNNTTGQANSIHSGNSKVYDTAVNLISGGKITISSDIGTATSFIQVRTEGGAVAVIDSIAIIYEGDPDPTIPEPPAVPTGLVVEAGDEEVTLSWNAARKVSHYILKYWSEADQSDLQSERVATNTHIVTGLTNGKTYYFAIQAHNEAGSSGDSPAKSATPIEGSAPEQPTGVLASAGDGFVSLRWDNIPNADSYSIKYWSSDSNPDSAELVSNIASNFHTIYNLNNGLTYYFVVEANNKRGTSQPSAQVNATPDAALSDKPLGFASLGNGGKGTTGGEGGSTVTVTSGAELNDVMRAREKAKSIEPVVVYVDGTLTFSEKPMLDVKDTSNVSIIGLGTDARIDGYGIKIVRANNIIIQNIEFTNARDDSVEVTQSHNVWINHNTFSDGYDGLLDVKEGSTNVTISWNHFKEHRKTSLVGHSDNNGSIDKNLQVTYHHNLFEGTYSRNPRVRFGQVHVVNNYYLSTGSSFDGGGYGVGAAADSHIYVEGNYFKNVKMPIIVGWSDWGASPIGRYPGFVGHSNNIYDNSGEPHTNDEGLNFNPTDYYVFPVDHPENIPQLVMRFAGVQKPAPDTIPDIPTGLTAVAGDKQVNLKWNPVSSAEEYIIKRSTTSGTGYQEVGRSKASSYTDSGLSNGTTYYYVVSAVNAHGESADSAVVLAVPEAAPPTGEPGDTDPPPTGEPGDTDPPPTGKPGDTAPPPTGGNQGGTSPSGPVNEDKPKSPTRPGVVVKAAKALIERNGATIAQYSVASDDLQDAFAAIVDKERKDQRITVIADTDNEKVVLKLPLDAVVEGSKITPDAVISFIAGYISYGLPLNAIDYAAYEELQKQKEAVLSLTIAQLNGRVGEQLAADARAAGLNMLTDAVEFAITISGQSMHLEVNDFAAYVTRTISFELEHPSLEHLTAAWYDDAKGEWVFVPSVLHSVDGRVEATIKRLSNSTYAIIEHYKTFDDIEKHWARDEIERLASKLVIKGMTDTMYMPEHRITRAEFASLLVRALGLKEKATDQFSDVKAHHWFAGAVGAAAEAGLVNGVSDASFDPNENITREQMAVMLSRALQLAGQDVAEHTSLLSRFEDQGMISEWAQQSVSQSIQVGIINGKSATLFAPQDDATRAEAAVMLKRFLQYVEFIN